MVQGVTQHGLGANDRRSRRSPSSKSWMQSRPASLPGTWRCRRPTGATTGGGHAVGSSVETRCQRCRQHDRWPAATEIGAAMAARSRLARRGPRRPARRLPQTTNSSPPRRATVSAERMAPSSRRPPRPQVVADGVAERVVDDLEPVKVEEEHRHRTGPAPRSGEGLTQLIHEQPTVGQPGQRVVQRAVQRPPEGRFGRECQRASAAVTPRSVRHIRITLNGSMGLVTPGRTGQMGQAPPGPGADSMVRGGEPAGRPRAGPVPSGAGIGPRNVLTHRARSGTPVVRPAGRPRKRRRCDTPRGAAR